MWWGRGTEGGRERGKKEMDTKQIHSWEVSYPRRRPQDKDLNGKWSQDHDALECEALNRMQASPWRVSEGAGIAAGDPPEGFWEVV